MLSKSDALLSYTCMLRDCYGSALSAQRRGSCNAEALAALSVWHGSHLDLPTV